MAKKQNAKAGLDGSPNSPAISSVRTLLAQMMQALDEEDSDKYWSAFEAVMNRHGELLAEVCQPENDKLRHGGENQNV